MSDKTFFLYLAFAVVLFLCCIGVVINSTHKHLQAFDVKCSAAGGTTIVDKNGRFNCVQGVKIHE